MVFYLFTPNTHQFVVSFSLAHQLNEPFFSSIPVEIVFPVTSQIPLTNYFPLAKGKVIKPIHMNEGSFFTTKHTMANLFAKFLRLAAAPRAHWSSLFRELSKKMFSQAI